GPAPLRLPAHVGAVAPPRPRRQCETGAPALVRGRLGPAAAAAPAQAPDRRAPAPAGGSAQRRVDLRPHPRCLCRRTRFKCSTVVDEFTKECLAITVARWLPGDRVLPVLAQLVARRGAPQYLRS